MGHERLTIVDPTSGNQPLYSQNGRYVLAANGEIYNHQELRKQFEGKYNFSTASDCEVILALYQEKGPSFVDEMNGIFGLPSTTQKTPILSRVTTWELFLYMGWDQHGTFCLRA